MNQERDNRVIGINKVRLYIYILASFGAILHSAYANVNAIWIPDISKNPFARRNGSAERS